MRSLILCSLLFLTTLSGVRADETSPAKTAPPATTETAAYRIAPQDVLDVTVQDHADLSKMATVLPDGTISYPYVGEFKASGLTLHEISDRITTALSKEIANPQVTVTIKTLHERPVSQVTVLGPLRTNGRFTLKEGWRVLDLLIEVGGLPTDRPAAFTANLIRNNAAGVPETIPLDLPHILSATDLKANLLLMPNDILMVREFTLPPNQVEILGEVGRTGLYALPKDGLLVPLLSAAGPTPRAALTKCTITHEGKMTTVDLSSYLSTGKIDDKIKLAPGDTLFIPVNKLFYTVYGAVAHQGKMSYPDSEPLTVMTALSAAGGQAQDANMKAVSVIHYVQGSKPVIKTINLEDVIKKGDISKDVALQPGDTIVVPARGHSRNPFSLPNVFSALSFAGLLGIGL